MEFNQNKPIYMQIADSICESILKEELKPESRIQSVRELGAEIGVNPNTVMRCYERMTSDGIIYNKRGIGYYVSENAKNIVLEKMRKEFLADELPLIVKKMKLLGIDLSALSSNI
jgi:GntR family transcriptional regulator